MAEKGRIEWIVIVTMNDLLSAVYDDDVPLVMVKASVGRFRRVDSERIGTVTLTFYRAGRRPNDVARLPVSPPFTGSSSDTPHPRGRRVGGPSLGVALAHRALGPRFVTPRTSRRCAFAAFALAMDRALGSGGPAALRVSPPSPRPGARPGRGASEFGGARSGRGEKAALLPRPRRRGLHSSNLAASAAHPRPRSSSALFYRPPHAGDGTPLHAVAAILASLGLIFPDAPCAARLAPVTLAGSSTLSTWLGTRGLPRGVSSRRRNYFGRGEPLRLLDGLLA